MAYPKPLLAELRRQGFKIAWRLRPTKHDSGCCEYTRMEGSRKLTVQLWGDGGHRASHYHTPPGYTLHGCMCTVPTDFTDVESMRKALENERTRTDHQHPKDRKAV